MSIIKNDEELIKENKDNFDVKTIESNSKAKSSQQNQKLTQSSKTILTTIQQHNSITEVNKNDESDYTNKELKLSYHYLEDMDPLSFRDKNQRGTILSDDSKSKDKLVTINSQVRQRKGDFTPNSNKTEINQNHLQSLKDDNFLLLSGLNNEKVRNKVDNKYCEEVIITNKQNQNLSTNEQISINKSKENFFSSPKYKIKKQSGCLDSSNNMKASKESSFVERMFFDIFKRKTKQERLTSLLKHQTKKSSEKTIIDTFNRLITDSNRRVEVNKETEKLVQKLEEEKINENKNKKRISKEKFGEIYRDRFIVKEEERVRKIEAEREKKNIEMKLKEDEIVKRLKEKKGSQVQIENTVRRLAADAEKRKLQKESLVNSYDQNSRSKTLSKSKEKLNSVENKKIVNQFCLTTFDNERKFTEKSLFKNSIDTLELTYSNNKKKINNLKKNTKNNLKNYRSTKTNKESLFKQSKSTADYRNELAKEKQINHVKFDKKLTKAESNLDEETNLIDKIYEENKQLPQPIEKYSAMSNFTKTYDFKSARLQNATSQQKKFIPYFLASSYVEKIIDKQGSQKNS